MHDFFSDGYFDKNYARQVRHSILSSIGVLLILTTLLFYGLKATEPNLPEDPGKFQTSAKIERLYRYDSTFVATISYLIDGEEASRNLEINEDDFLKYKEGETIVVEIHGSNCHIVDDNQ